MRRPLLFCASVSEGKTQRKLSTYIRAYTLFGLECGPVAGSCKDGNERSGGPQTVGQLWTSFSTTMQVSTVWRLVTVVRSTTRTAENYQLCAWMPLRHTMPPAPSRAINLSDPHQCSSVQGIKMALTYPTCHALHRGTWRSQLLLSRNNCHYENERLFRVRTPWSHASGMADESATMTWTAYPTATKDVYH